jgi:hypothetical protein
MCCEDCPNYLTCVEQDLCCKRCKYYDDGNCNYSGESDEE